MVMTYRSSAAQEMTSLGSTKKSRAGWAARLLVPCALGVSLAQASTIQLAPQHAGSFGPGTGIDATFLRIDEDWRGSTVLWNEDTKTYGNGSAIGGFGWGTGLWGLADFNAIQVAGAGFLAGQPTQPVEAAWAGQATSINFGNARYNECYGKSQWGPVSLAPLFNSATGTGAPCTNDDGSTPDQTNWTALFTGFLRITVADDYWFGVLNDDGYYLRLTGANGDEVNASRDFLNPRERNGPEGPIALTEGLYALELGAWNRLGAGVVDFRWRTDGTQEWDLVPTANLLTRQGVPEPGVPALLGMALAAGWLARRQARCQWHAGRH